MIAEMLQKKFLWDVKIYFYSIKINFYSIKYIHMILKVHGLLTPRKITLRLGLGFGLG